MKHVLAALVFVACAAASLSCGGTTTSPSSESTASSSAADPTIDFSGLADGAPLTTYTEFGYTVSAMSGEWSVRTTYGHPAPFVQFWASGGSTVTGDIQVRAGGSVFYFRSVDLYSSTTPIPYTIRGTRNSTTVFTISDTVPNTFGNFRTVVNPNATQPIDTLSIALSNAAAPCCRNPMGLDTIVVSSTPSAPPIAPATFTLSGQVSDSATAAAISGAAVLITDGPNGGRSTTTDASGHYSLAQLLQSDFTVKVSASTYLAQSKAVTLTSDQTLSVELTREPMPPRPPGAIVIEFNGLTVNRATVTSYTESGFTVSTSSGAWEAITTYGHPPPFIEFLADGARSVDGEIRVAAGRSTFRFASIDLYSSTTPIPYTIRGFRNSSNVFAVGGTLPNTYGGFRTVTNLYPSTVIDALSIVLTNTAAACCSNPMGLDTIVLTP
jgi:hypothetical protein